MLDKPDARDLLQLVYTSRAAAPFGDDALLNLLKKARRYNAAAGVTGVLMVHGGLFVQCLEGPSAVVEELFGRIERDPRHAHVVVMIEHRVAGWAFPEWSMGCTRVSASETVALSTATWSAFERGATATSPGFVLLQSLWREHQGSAL